MVPEIIEERILHPSSSLLCCLGGITIRKVYPYRRCYTWTVGYTGMLGFSFQ